MKEFLLSYINELLMLLIAGFSGWFFSRKKQKAEVEGAEIDNNIKVVGLYKDTLDDLSKRYEIKFNEIVALYEKKQKLLKDEIGMLNRRVKMLRQENISLKKRVLELEQQQDNDNNRTQ
jgi:hypothetical protein